MTPLFCFQAFHHNILLLAPRRTPRLKPYFVGNWFRVAVQIWLLQTEAAPGLGDDGHTSHYFQITAAIHFNMISIHGIHHNTKYWCHMAGLNSSISSINIFKDVWSIFQTFLPDCWIQQFYLLSSPIFWCTFQLIFINKFQKELKVEECL
jgi:hypothetical protein